jgi:hypothetical protein
MELTELDRVQQSVRRGCPLGSDRWVNQTARRLGLEFTLRPRGTITFSKLQAICAIEEVSSK